MSELYELPDGWEWKTLSDIFIIERGGSPRPIKDYITEDDDGINWIKIGDTVKGEKYIESTEQKIKPSGLKHSRLVTEGDFIMSNSMSFGRPYIVKTKGAIHDGWLLMREKLDNTDKDFFYYLLSSNYMYQQFIEKASGTTVKNLNIGLVKTTNIPLPPLPEQQRIVSKLDLLFEKIDKSIALHQKNMDEANAFMGSVLNDVFGELEEKYTKIPLFEVADVSRGKSKHRPRNDKRLFGGNYPFIQTGDVRNADKYITTYTNTYSEFGLAQSKLWKKGTICMTIAANIGDVAILNMDSCFPDSVVGLYSENNSNDYLYFFLQTLKQHLESKATTTAQMNINLKVLQTIGVPLPPLLIQEKTVKYLNEMYEKIEKIKQLQKEKMASLKALKASILDSAFRGEL
ncbi:MAG TPA: restriction endonuclease subunit S [Sulfurimonas sp.]|uniref:restriction endonuclease subunit S n=1 Tax=Sulfurimonas sp. TaxID=2022749 RepID=UPI002C009DCA|nr:restriction endonuclease subunit S [Sulfurimonas sp.]HUH43420.1 restriction endonuclease subunit S [Sulfurimonas sp.]